MAENINRVALTGNLTRDPELRQLQSGSKLCSMRIAVNSRVKRGDEWKDKANYVNVTVFGANAENCAKFLAKGKPVAIDGRLDWNEWEKDGTRHEGITIIADNVQFLGDGKSGSQSTPAPAGTSPAPRDGEDIPF